MPRAMLASGESVEFKVDREGKITVNGEHRGAVGRLNRNEWLAESHDGKASKTAPTRDIAVKEMLLRHSRLS